MIENESGSDKGSIVTRRRLHASAVRAVLEGGSEASVRTIARGAGVSGAALYRHYTGLEELYGAVFEELVLPMIAEKENLVAMRAALADRVREWVRCTYACFDRDPDAFAYVFLSNRPLPERHEALAGVQTKLFVEMLQSAGRKSFATGSDIKLMSSLFAAMLLAVPARIRSAEIAGPALKYVDTVSLASCRMIGIVEPA